MYEQVAADDYARVRAQIRARREALLRQRIRVLLASSSTTVLSSSNCGEVPRRAEKTIMRICNKMPFLPNELRSARFGVNSAVD